MFAYTTEKLKLLLRKGRHIMVWGLLLSMLVGVLELGTPVEEAMQAGRNKLRSHAASGEIIIVGIDALAEEEIGEWPWSYDKLAHMIENLNKAGAKRIFFDFPTNARKSSSENAGFAKALKDSNAQVYLNARFDVTKAGGNVQNKIPPGIFRKHAKLVSNNFRSGPFKTVESLPYNVMVGDLPVDNIAAVIAGETDSPFSVFPIDYSIDVNTIPYISASDLLAENNLRDQIFGKDVIIGLNNTNLSQEYWILGKSYSVSVFISALGAETLRTGKPIEFGWLPILLIIYTATWFANKIKQKIIRRSSKLTFLATLFILPGIAESQGVFITILPALFYLTVFTVGSFWIRHSRSYKLRGTINEISGLPNLTALREFDMPGEYALIAARIQNFVEVATTLPANSEGAFVKQISNRLAFGTSGETLFQGDEGIFFWRVPTEQRDILADQLSALQAIFRNPVPVGDSRYDLDICFGIDVDSERSLSNRMSSALLAAQGAHESGEHWKFYDPSHQQETAWKLSMLGELDDAIDNGELWVAFQPKLDLRTNSITGAEALVRWTHPTKGDISPEDFVLAAEKHNRIHKLTEFVLSESLTLAHHFNASGIAFDIAVNLSSRLLDQPGLSEMIDRVFSGRTLSRTRLMLEVTETAAISSSDDAMQQLQAVRAMGIGISIDDYGTGFSTLDYLKKCPAGEVKIDRSFVSNLVHSNSDRIMVNSTIELAHSLGQVVVAEGVEDKQTLKALRDMKCDMVQGYLIGRPMQFPALQKFMQEFAGKNAA